MKFEFVTSAIKPSVPDSHRTVLVKESDLPLHCPVKTASKWNLHPKVYISMDRSAEGGALCPYCGTVYKFSDSA